jgi:capsular exopolysaccharide synthesis family protein
MQEDQEVNLDQVVRILWRRLPMIVLCTAVAAGAAYALSKRETKQYAATASLSFSDNLLSEQIAGVQPVNGSALTSNQSNDLELVKLGDMAAKTASALGGGLTERKVSNSLSFSGGGESSVVSATSTTSSPALSAEIANTYVKQVASERHAANRQYFKAALALVNSQLAAIPRTQQFGAAAVALQNRAQTLRLLDALHYGDVQIAQEALAPTGPTSPKISRNTLLGAIFGLLIGLGLAFLLERLDRRIRRADELEAIYRLPLLGEVGKNAALARVARGGGDEPGTLPLVESEAFSLIRAHLRFFNVGRDLKTIAVASPAPGEGKTTVALQLAAAAARLGSRVLLLEADLRQPTLAQQIGLRSGPGFADVLIGTVPMDEAIQSVPLQTSPTFPAGGEGASARTLDVLGAGSILPPNPGELIESPATSDVLGRARSVYDLVVVDTASLIVVSDGFPLLARVDGVILVGWIGRSRRGPAESLRRVLDSSVAPLLGVVANGSRSSGARAGHTVRAEPAQPQDADPLAGIRPSAGSAPQTLTRAPTNH